MLSTSLVVANLQLFRAISEFGDQALEDMLRANPGSYLTMLNSLCNTVQPTIALENHRMASECKAKDTLGKDQNQKA